MNRDPILFRVDGSPEAGYERLARCLILSAALQRRRRPIYFLSRLEPRSPALTIKRIGNEWLPTDEPIGSADDLDLVRQEVRRLRPAAIVLDGEVEQSYVDEISAAGPMLMHFDHQGMLRYNAPVLINPLLGPSRENYDFAAGTQILMGPRYALVRPEIRRHRPTRAQEPPPLPMPPGKAGAGQYRALVALGEDDPNRQSLELAKLLLAAPKIGRVDVIVRHEHPQLEKLRALAGQHPERLEIAVDPPEVVARLVRCHFAITSGSGWSLELTCLGVPQLLVVQNEAHWPNAQRLEEEGCATCLGWHESVSAQTIRVAVQNILSDPMERQVMSRCGRNLIDGRGPDRMVNAMEIMLHSPARMVSAFAVAA